MSIDGIFLAALLVLGGWLLGIVFLWLKHRPFASNRQLKPYYLRLGRTAPGEACPCGRSGPAPRAYGECCRPADVQALLEEIQAFLWKHWSRRSFAGRRRSRSMQHRLEDYPLPSLSLPEWVECPDKFSFPIDEEALRRWNPLTVKAVDRRVGEIEEETARGELF